MKSKEELAKEIQEMINKLETKTFRSDSTREAVALTSIAISNLYRALVALY
jgi:hypothetical protein